MALFGSIGSPRVTEVTGVAGADIHVLTGLISLGNSLPPLVPELVEDTIL